MNKILVTNSYYQPIGRHFHLKRLQNPTDQRNTYLTYLLQMVNQIASNETYYEILIDEQYRDYFYKIANFDEQALEKLRQSVRRSREELIQNGFLTD